MQGFFFERIKKTVIICITLIHNSMMRHYLVILLRPEQATAPEKWMTCVHFSNTVYFLTLHYQLILSTLSIITYKCYYIFVKPEKNSFLL